MGHLFWFRKGVYGVDSIIVKIGYLRESERTNRKIHEVGIVPHIWPTRLPWNTEITHLYGWIPRNTENCTLQGTHIPHHHQLVKSVCTRKHPRSHQTCQSVFDDRYRTTNHLSHKHSSMNCKLYSTSPRKMYTSGQSHPIISQARDRHCL